MSSTWDSKDLKAVPLSADEVLIIDTADSRNQKRATISSLPFGITTSNVGTGEGLALPPIVNNFPFKSLIGIAPIVLTGNANDITFSLNPLTNSDLASGAFPNITSTAAWTKSGTFIFPTTLTDDVGIGLNAPSFKLEVFDTVNTVARFQSNAATTRVLIENATNTGFGLSIGGDVKWSNASFLSSGTNFDFTIFNEQTGIASIFIDGDTDNVGIGDNFTPSAKLHVLGTGKFTGALDMTNNQINNGADPTLAQDFATKNYVDTHTVNGLWTKSGATIVPTELADKVGIGVSPPNEQLHVLSSGTSTFVNPMGPRGILITDNIGPRLIFENSGEGAGDKIMMLRYESESLVVSSTDDAGSTFVTENILVMNRGGNVGIGTAFPGFPLEVSTTTETNIARFVTTVATGGIRVSGAITSEYTLQITTVPKWTMQTTVSSGSNFDYLINNVEFATTPFFIDGDSDFVGINTILPTAQLHVNGTALITNTLDMNATKVFNAADPTLAQDLATKNYVDTHTVNGLWTLSGSNVVLTTITDRVGIGTTTPANDLHVLTSGTSVYAGANRGIVITDNVGPRIALEDTSQGTDLKTLVFRLEGQILRLSAINDAGSAFINENIITANRNGNVGIGATPGSALLQLGLNNNGDLLKFDSDRAWTFGAIGSGSSTQLSLRPDVDSKFFNIISQDQATIIASFFVSNSAFTDNISFVPDGGSVIIGGVTASSKAILDLTSTNAGFLPPRMTTAQKNAITLVPTSLMVNDTDLNTLERYSGVEWRSFGTQGDTTREAWAIVDFPAAVSNVITLSSGITFLKKTISTADRFDFGTSQNILLNGVDPLNISLTYTGVATFLTANTNTAWDVNELSVLCTGNGAQIFDIQGGNISINSSNFLMSGTTPTIGTIQDTVSSFMRDNTFTGFQTGLSTNDGFGIVLEDSTFRSNQQDTGSALNLLGQMQGFAQIDTCSFVVGVNASAVFIDPQIIGGVSLKDCFVPIGQFFQGKPTGTFSAASDESVTNSIINVLDDFPNAIFDHGSPITNMVNGDIVVHTGFSESTYNGTFEVINFSSAAYEVRDPITKVAVAFVANDSGSGTTSLTRFTSTTHGLVEGENVVVISSLYIDKGSDIRGTPLTNSFDLKIPFNGTDAGEWGVDLFEFSAATDQSVSNTITSVEAIAFGTRFVASGGISGLADKEIVTHTGFTTAFQYNGVFLVTNVLSNSYDVVRQPAQFSVTDSGASDSNLTRFDTIDHGLIVGQGVQVESSLYSAGGRIKAIATSSIDVSIAFQGNDIGSLNINSLNQKDPRVTVIDSTGSPNSQITGGWFSTGNTTETTGINASTYVDLVILGDGLVSSFNSNERVKVTNTVNGEIQYTGLALSELITTHFFVAATVVTAGDRNYLLKLVVDKGAGYVDFPDVVELSLDFSGAPVDTTFVRKVSVDPGWKLKWQIKGDTSTDDVTFGDCTYQV